MHPDKLEARCCRKEKIAMEKLGKSRCCKGRCCKVDGVKVKGLPRGGLFDIGVYRFSDHAGSLFMSRGQTWLLADHDTVYLHLKTRTAKNRKRSLRSFKNWLLTHCQLWIDPLPPYFPSSVFIWKLSSSCPSADPLVCHRPIALTCWPTVRAEPFWPSADLVDYSILPSIGRLHSTASPYPFLTLFF
jgi:hypothetical protein